MQDSALGGAVLQRKVRFAKKKKKKILMGPRTGIFALQNFCVAISLKQLSSSRRCGTRVNLKKKIVAWFQRSLDSLCSWVLVCINVLKLWGHHGNCRTIALWSYNFPCDLEGKEAQRKPNVTIANTFKSDVCPSFWIGGKGNAKFSTTQTRLGATNWVARLPLRACWWPLKLTRPVMNCFLRRLILSSLAFG